MDELYTLYSLGQPEHYPDAQPGDDQRVELEWFCVDRPQPIAAYATLLRGYTELREPYRDQAQRYLDELFTGEDVRLLLPYVAARYGQQVGVRVLPMPMDIWVAEGQSMAAPTSLILASGGWSIAHTLAPQEAGYPLPFTVSAYYQRKRPSQG